MTRVAAVAVIHAGALIAALLAGGAAAQEETAVPADGTTIVGERESAVGLYLAPWQDEDASDIDRPPALFAPTLEKIDGDAFRRQTQYEDAINAYRRERLFRSR